MRPGENGEVILDNRLDGWYVKVGARLLGDKALLNHVQEVKREGRNDFETGLALSPEFTPNVRQSLEAVAELDEFRALRWAVYPWAATLLIKHLDNPAEQA